jgi:calpain-15
VDENSLSEIVATCIANGSLFCDDTFPANDKSLFFNGEAARMSWTCHDCNKSNQMPNEDVLEQYRRQNPSREQIQEFFRFISQTNPMLAMTMQSNPSAAVQLMVQSMSGGNVAPLPPLKCGHCNGEFPLGVLEAKPSMWLRPSEIRDEVTATYGAGAPWKLFRDDPRADDVKQGAVGNCWFLGALSILAHQNPKLIRSLFPFNQEYSDQGVYLIRLCKDGLWRNVIIDDNLPCNRNKGLSYTSAARRQLWVPLIEKAAAKLATCYEGLHSGTLCEAFSLLTGYATERQLLVVSEEDDGSVKDVWWARLVSAHSAGYLIGLACSEKRAMSKRETFPSATELHDLGLQAPHAYIVLDTRELTDGTRLVHLGNPWGDRSPSTWKGPWGNSSAEYRTAVTKGTLPKDLNDVKSNGQFWISWDDVLKCFASLEVCRTDLSDMNKESRTRGWLPAATGLGDYFELSVPTDLAQQIRVDISMYQESHAVRESAKGTSTTGVDLGMVVAELTDKELKCVACVPRTCQPEISHEVFLKPGCRYVLVPLSFFNSFKVEHRKVAACVRSKESLGEVELKKTQQSTGMLQQAIHEYSKWISESQVKEVAPGLEYSVTKDNAGAVITCRNRTCNVFYTVSVDADDCSSVISSRGVSGATIVNDIIGPARKQVLMILTAKPGAKSYSLSVSVAVGINIQTQIESYGPPIYSEDSDEQVSGILGIHASAKISLAQTIPFSSLITRARDPRTQMMMMQISSARQIEIQRLIESYLSAGIELSDAKLIAEEEVDNKYI